ncbi:hypothetical protein [Streptomyces sp. NPDC102462]|uniref:hypothetical protein n=1 Tax=Streptomyces sp. NPDC102462 TaxID=3366178 RepID=UPI0037FA1790
MSASALQATSTASWSAAHAVATVWMGCYVTVCSYLRRDERNLVGRHDPANLTIADCIA